MYWELISLPSKSPVILTNTYREKMKMMKIPIYCFILQSAHLLSLIPRLIWGVLGMGLYTSKDEYIE